MKKKTAIFNLTAAFGAFLFWGNLVSFLLPAEQYGAIIKTVDFATALFLLAVLATACVRLVRQRRRKNGEDKSREEKGRK